MPSLCNNLKTEYEHLKTLNKEFVSACEKAGDPRALSADQLRTLQIQKRKLEQARDLLHDTIEPKETKTFKQLYKRITTAVVHDAGPYQGMSVQEIMRGDVFKKSLIDWIEQYIQAAQYNSYHSFVAVTGLHAASELGLLSEAEEEKMRIMMSDGTFMIVLDSFIQDHIKQGTYDSAKAYRAVVTLHAARALGVFEAEDKRKILLDYQYGNRLRRNTISCMNAFDSTSAGLNGYAALIGLDVQLNSREHQKIQKKIESEELQERVVRDVLEMIQKIHLYGDHARIIAMDVCALKQLITFSLQRKLKI